MGVKVHLCHQLHADRSEEEDCKNINILALGLQGGSVQGLGRWAAPEPRVPIRKFREPAHQHHRTKLLGHRFDNWITLASPPQHGYVNVNVNTHAKRIACLVESGSKTRGHQGLQPLTPNSRRQEAHPNALHKTSTPQPLRVESWGRQRKSDQTTWPRPFENETPTCNLTRKVNETEDPGPGRGTEGVVTPHHDEAPRHLEPLLASSMDLLQSSEEKLLFVSE